MIEAHRTTAALYRRLVWSLVALGVVLAVLGLLAEGWRWLSAVGIVLALAALVPWKKAIEHDERAEGMAVLKDEWADAAPGAGREQLHTLVRNLYGAASAGSGARTESA